MSEQSDPAAPAEPCPPWCDGEHIEPGDATCGRHQSATRVVPIIQPRGHGHRPGDDVAGAELSVLAFRDIGRRETWIAIAGEEQALELTLESARRLHAAFGALLHDI